MGCGESGVDGGKYYKWFTCLRFTALCLGVAECEGVLRAGVDAGAEEEPGAAGIHQTAGEQDAPPGQRLHACQTGITPLSFPLLSGFSDLQYYSSVCLVSFLKGSFSAVICGPVSCPSSNPPGAPNLLPDHGYNPSPSFFPAPPGPETGRRGKSQSSSAPPGALGDSRQEVHDLKEQLEALRCQVGCSLQHSIKNLLPFPY